MFLQKCEKARNCMSLFQHFNKTEATSYLQFFWERLCIPSSKLKRKHLYKGVPLLIWVRKNMNSEPISSLQGFKFKCPLCLLHNCYITANLRLQRDLTRSVLFSSAKCREKNCWMWTTRLWNTEICLQDEICGAGARKNVFSWET